MPQRQARCWADSRHVWTTGRCWSSRGWTTSTTTSASWPATAPCSARARYASEVAGLYRAYRERLDAAGLVDRELFAWRALDALRAQPRRWGRTPVFVYGFDDFTDLELDALETLGTRCETDVV